MIRRWTHVRDGKEGGQIDHTVHEDESVTGPQMLITHHYPNIEKRFSSRSIEMTVEFAYQCILLVQLKKESETKHLSDSETRAVVGAGLGVPVSKISRTRTTPSTSTCFRYLKRI
jgi:hypothetical protein